MQNSQPIIEHIHFHRIDIYKTDSLFKLNVKLRNKPVVLSLHGMPVLKSIIEHSEYLKSLLEMDTLYQLKIVVPGYGVFNQKYELEQIGLLFRHMAEYSNTSYKGLEKLWIEMPGWRTFTSQVFNNMFRFIKICSSLQELTLNLNNIMNLQPLLTKQDQQADTFYDKRLFKTEEFEDLLRYMSELMLSTSLSRQERDDPFLRKLELSFGGWQGIDTAIVQILANSLQKIFHRYLKVFRIDLNGWGSPNSVIDTKVLDKMFKVLQDFQHDYELIEIDMRNWAERYKINRYRERFQILSGTNRKSEQNPFNGMYSMMTGTHFFGSQLKSKLSRPLKVQIKM